MKKIWNRNLMLRIAVGMTGGPVIFFSALYSKFLFFLCFLIVMIYCLKEIYGIAINFGIKSKFITGFVFGILIFLDFYYFEGKNSFLLLMIFAIYLSIEAIFSKEENPFSIVYYTYFWTIYIVCFLGTLILIRVDETISLSFSGRVVGLILLAVWFLDTFAYFGGKLFGKHKLIPEVSPGKTVEGSIIGILGAFMTVIIYKAIAFNSISFLHCVVMTVVICISGQVGDIIESLLKRKAGIKDSSSYLPGHGGVLDRFDSLIFCSPFVYIYVKFFIFKI